MRAAHWNTASIRGTRPRNEDVVRIRSGNPASTSRHPVAVVCDGLGGHGTGAAAARTAARAFMSAYEGRTTAGAPVARALREAALDANEAIRLAIKSDMELRNMGTTLSAAAVTAAGLEWINVGDSPIYVYRTEAGELHEISVRHNRPGMPNRLTSALLGGHIPHVSAGSEPLALEAGDIVLLASDGIDTIGPTGIREACGTEARSGRGALAGRLLDAVVREAAARQDNATVAALSITRALPDRRRGTGIAFQGRRTPDGAEVTVGGEPLRWQRTLTVSNHSPSGPEWGYHGSGPSQLALAMLIEIADAGTATAHYQRFKDERIAGLGADEWSMPYDEVADWLDRAEKGAAAGKLPTPAAGA